MKNAAKGTSPVKITMYLVLKYQGLSGIILGTGLTLQGVLNALFLIPTNDPINTKGDEQHSHRTNSERMSENLS